MATHQQAIEKALQGNGQLRQGMERSAVDVTQSSTQQQLSKELEKALERARQRTRTRER
jgi:hypothetical protein